MAHKMMISGPKCLDLSMFEKTALASLKSRLGHLPTVIARRGRDCVVVVGDMSDCVEDLLDDAYSYIGAPGDEIVVVTDEFDDGLNDGVVMKHLKNGVVVKTRILPYVFLKGRVKVKWWVSV